MAAIKKPKVVLAQPAVGASASRLPFFFHAPGPGRGAGDEAAYRASLRYRALLQDYQELIKETQAKKNRLHMERLRKQKLLAEVRLKNPVMSSASWTAALPGDGQHQSIHDAGSSSTSQLVHRRRGGSPRASPVIDLSRFLSFQGYKEMEIKEHHGYKARLGANKSKRYVMEGDAAVGSS